MDQATINRYQPGGDLYATLLAQYGQASANAIASAARTGDNNGEVAAAIANARTAAGITKGQQDDSTLDAFGNLIATDPFGAPLADLEAAASTAGSSFFFGLLKSPWVIGTIVAVIFFAAGGGQWLFRILKGKLNK